MSRLLRDRFWRAFWRRQQKHLPPAARIAITGCYVHVPPEAKVPAINVEVGREWKA